jgi:hypothetical protein
MVEIGITTVLDGSAEIQGRWMHMAGNGISSHMETQVAVKFRSCGNNPFLKGNRSIDSLEG